MEQKSLLSQMKWTLRACVLGTGKCDRPVGCEGEVAFWADPSGERHFERMDETHRTEGLTMLEEVPAEDRQLLLDEMEAKRVLED
jgi:hypothetical protein